MRRVVTVIAVLLASAGLVLATGGFSSGTSSKPAYRVELDNAFGLIAGADFKVAGVRVGKITELKLDRKTNRALVGVEVSDTGFGRLRRDVTCSSKPQSLIGEYFVDCQPGTDRRAFPRGGTIPVTQTSSTVAPDLVTNVLRMPYKERLRLIINELGAGVAGRSGDLNAAIRRAVPALKQTDRLLAVLARQNRTLADLATNGDAVVTALARNRRDVGRFVGAARDTAVASAARKRELATTFRRLPAFLDQLAPTMRQLGVVADRQTPALRNLDATAVSFKTFLDELGPFSDSSRVAFRGLGQALKVGSQALKPLTPTIDELRRFTKNTPELAKNLRIVLRDLDDRKRAVEKDPRSPGGQGYTGLEALMQYFFNQSQAINIFDRNGHILKVSARLDPDCGPYHSAEFLKANPAVRKKCGSYLGPNQPGVTTPDPTAGPQAKAIAATERKRADLVRSAVAASQQKTTTIPGLGAGSVPAPRTLAGDLRDTVTKLLQGQLPALPAIPGISQLLQAAGIGTAVPPQGAPVSQDQAATLLDYLLSP